MPSGWKLLFYDNLLRTPYHRNYCLSIILWDWAGTLPPGPALHRPGRCGQLMQGGGARRRTLWFFGGGSAPGNSIRSQALRASAPGPPRPRRFSTGAPPPGPGVLFARAKSTQKHAKRPRPPSLGLRPIHLAQGFGFLCLISLYQTLPVSSH